MNKNFACVVYLLSGQCLGRNSREQWKCRRIFLLYILLAFSSSSTVWIRILSRSPLLITTDRRTNEWWSKLLFNISILVYSVGCSSSVSSSNFINFRVSFMTHHVSVLTVTRSSHTFWKEKSSICIRDFKYRVLTIPILTHVPMQGWNELSFLQKYTFLIIHCADNQDIK